MCSSDLAEQFDPLNLEARMVDVLAGVAFGGIHHLGAPAEIDPKIRDAALAALNARHLADIAPGRPENLEAVAAHADATELAFEQLLRGDTVDVAPSGVQEADFAPKPQTQMPELPADLVALDAEQPPALPKAMAEEIAGLSVPESTRTQLGEAYTKAAATKPAFEAQVRAVAADIGATIDPMLAPLKGVARAAEKSMADYGGDASRLKDILRATVIIDNIEQIQKAIEHVQRRFAGVTKFRDTLRSPLETTDGYRDVNMNVVIDGQVAELQINLPEMVRAKEANHALYEERRTIESKGSELTAADVARINELDGAMKASYAVAWNEALSRLKAGSSTSAPSSLAQDSVTGRPAGTSKALTDTPPSGVGSAATGTPPTSQKTGDLPRTEAPTKSPPTGGIVADSQASGGTAHNGPGAVSTVYTSSGRAIQVRSKVVEAADLKTSNQPGYPEGLQPRDRADRSSSDMQIQRIANELHPEMLGESATADTGAPIVGPDNAVESGNGRVEAIRKVYRKKTGEAAQAYREFLTAQGYDITGMKNPVLVRERLTPLEGAERQAFTVEANKPTIMAMSAIERAKADAVNLDEAMLDKLKPGDLTTTTNLGFIRAFIGKLAPGEHNAMLDADGHVSQEGVRRVQAAILAKAYGGTPEGAAVLGRMLESTDAESRSVLGALTDAAPEFAKLRDAVARGEVAPEFDVAGKVTRAVEEFVALRAKGQHLSEVIGQSDMLTPRDSTVDAILKAFYNDKGVRVNGRDRIAGALMKYAKDAAAVSKDQGDMFGTEKRTPDALLSQARDEFKEPTAVPQEDLFAVAPAEKVADSVTGPVAVGVNADGSPIIGSARDALAAADTEIAQAEKQAKGIEAAVACFLARGAA